MSDKPRACIETHFREKCARVWFAGPGATGSRKNPDLLVRLEWEKFDPRIAPAGSGWDPRNPMMPAVIGDTVLGFGLKQALEDAGFDVAMECLT